MKHYFELLQNGPTASAMDVVKTGSIKLHVTLRRIHSNIFAVESKKYSYSECVYVVLAVKHAMYMRPTVICVTLRRIHSNIFAVESKKYSYSECVYVVLAVKHAMYMRPTVICGLADSAIFFPHYHINGAIFELFFLKKFSF